MVGKVWRNPGNIYGRRLADDLLQRRHSPMTRAPYTGTSRKLVLAFDIGTTFSGAAYALLDPGFPPDILSVTK